MPRNAVQIHAIAQKLTKSLPSNKKLLPGDMSYITTCSRLISIELEKYYYGTGLTPPNIETVRGWFYSGCPDWAIVILIHATTDI
jgi:hypothetical protein